jgi:hypothetical protein
MGKNVCVERRPAKNDRNEYPMPKNMMPSILTVDGIEMKAAQFLRLIAQTPVDPTGNVLSECG